mgnify:FL=1
MRNSLPLALITCLGATALAGCPEEVPPDEPTMTATTRTGSFSIPVDGSEMQVFVLARAEGAADNSDMSIDVSAGEVAATSADFEAGAGARTLTLTPAGGSAEFRFRCDVGQPGTVTLNISNANSSFSEDIDCQEPTGTPIIIVDSDECDDLAADGQSRCAVNVQLSYSADYPAAGETVQANVGTVTAINGTDVDDDVLATTADPATGMASSVSVVSDDTGIATFYVGSPEVLLEQTMEISIVVGGATETITVTLDPFVNRSELTFAPTAVQINGGGTANVVLNVTSPSGDVPATTTATTEAGGILSSDRVKLTVQGNNDDVTLASAQGVNEDGSVAATSGSEIVVGTDENGEIPVSIETSVVDDSKTVTILASYRPIDSLDPLTQVLDVLIQPEGTLQLNGTVSPLVIKSDEAESATVSVEVSLDGAVRPGATVVFTPANGDGERIGFGTYPDLESSVTVTTDADGAASVDVSARNDLVRGPATIVASVSYDDGTDVREAYAEITVEIEREPVLQSLVFLQSNPSVIGVRGGAIQSSSVLSFQVLDDNNDPVPGVVVEFDVNTTASPGASVSAASAITAADGTVSIVLSAGTQAGPITVVATATLNDDVLQVESGPVAVIGGLPTFGNSYLNCDTENIYQRGGFTTECTVALVDRFTDISTLEQVVHFRAEGGNITPAVTTEEGFAVATFTTGEPGIVRHDAPGFSEGLIIPYLESELLAPNDHNDNNRFFAPENCFDGRSHTACDLIEMCDDTEVGQEDNLFFCPLAVEDDGTGCWEPIAAAMKTYEDFLEANPAFELTPFNYATNTQFKAAVDGVVAVHENCGYALPCLTGQGTMFPFLSRPLTCKSALGCFDFDYTTPCPQNGLRTILASTRGEESFVDTNGNGVFDYDDVNENNTHDPGEPSEPWVDMPEPFLDKNGNCSRNDFTNHPRMTTIEAFTNTDLFSDEDGSGTFGYQDPVSGETTEANGKWDRDKEIFFQAHMVALNGTPADSIRYGEPCNPDSADASGRIICDAICDSEDLATCGLPSASDTGFCREVTPGVFLSQECTDLKFNTPLEHRQEFSFTIVFADDNGNMYSPGFGGDFSVDSNLVLVDGDTQAALSETYPLTVDTFGSGARNPERPWCEDFPVLGAPTFDVTVSLDCLLITLPINEPPTVTVNLSAGGESVALANTQSINEQSCADVLSTIDTGG